MSSLVMMTGTFDIAVPAQAGLTCKIDTDGDGVYEYIRPNCTTFQQTHSYRLGSATGVTPKMVILNSGGTTVASYSWYARLDEDTILPNASRTTWDKAGVTYITPSGCDIAVGSTVNATTIQTAIDSAAASSQVAAGGTCYASIPAGTYSITSTINLKSGVILRGAVPSAGATVASTILNANINGSVISAAGGGTINLGSGPPVDLYDAVSNQYLARSASGRRCAQSSSRQSASCSLSLFLRSTEASAALSAMLQRSSPSARRCCFLQ